MKNMLVTGGCGFIGANFIHYLLKESGFTGRVINMDKLTYAGNPENLTGIAGSFYSSCASISSPEVVGSVSPDVLLSLV